MSLRKMCRELVLEALIRRAQASESADGLARLQLVVDEQTQRVLNSFLKVTNLSDEGIVSIDLINNDREPLPDLDAMYVLKPTAETLDRLMEDFKQKEKPQHNAIHVVLTSHLEQYDMDRIASAPNMASRVKSLMEVPLSFIAVQDRGFHFDMPQSIPKLFPRPIPGEGDALLREIGHRLVHVCRCLQQTAPVIRHYAHSQVCQAVAEHVEQELSIYKRPNIGTAQKKELPCQLVILDRSYDIAATLVHDYHYEALAYDVLDGTGMLDVDRNVVKLDHSGQAKRPVARSSMVEPKKSSRSSKQPEEEAAPLLPSREALLSDSDVLWEKLKHLHIEYAKQEAQQNLTDIQAKAAVAQADDIGVNDLLAQLRKTPEFKEALEKLDLHMSMLSLVNERVNQERLHDGVGKLEQNIACGIDDQARVVKPADMQQSLSKLVTEMPDLPGETKLRLLMLYLACMANVNEHARELLIANCSLTPEDNHVLMNFFQTKLMEVPEYLQNKLGHKNTVHRGVKTNQAGRFKKNAREEGRFDLSRFDPKVKELLEQLWNGKLSEEDFIRLGDATAEAPLSLRQAAGATAGAAPEAPATDNWAFSAAEAPASNGFGAKTEPEAPAELIQRIIVFIIGGVTYTEFRVASEFVHHKDVPAGVEVLMGGTSLLTPRKLIQALRPQSEAQAEDPLDLT